MRKFLSLLLAAVLICTSVILPASAEELMGNEQLVAIQDEQISVQPYVWGTQSTSHICFVSSGRLLAGSGSSVSSSQYAQGDQSMQWIFEEYIFDPTTYMSATVIRLASNPSYVLSATTSGSVLLAPYSEYSSYIQYWTEGSFYNMTCLATDSNFDGVGEFYLCMSETAPYGISTVTSPYEACSVGLIDPNTISPNGTMVVSDAIVTINGYKQLEPPSSTNMSAGAALGNPWLLYSSSNTAICSVDSQGRVFGNSVGTATITITHKILGISCICTVDVVNPQYVNMKMLYPHGYPSTSFHSTLSQAVSIFYETYGLLFSVSSESSPAMTAILEGCTTGNSICNSSCGPELYCNNPGNINTHHKSATRLVQSTLVSDYPYSIRYTPYPLCVYQLRNSTGQTEHHQINGGAEDGTTNMIVYDDGSAVGTTLHEISHTFGTLDNTPLSQNCTGSFCVMQSADSGWCSGCFNIIKNSIYS